MRTVPVRWVASDGIRVLEGVYEANDDGRLRLREWRGETARLPEKVAEAPTAKGCAKCAAKSEIVRWLRLRWHGTPWPLRHWFGYFSIDRPDDWAGCGCLVKAKAAWMAVKAGIIAVKRA